MPYKTKAMGSQSEIFYITSNFNVLYIKKLYNVKFICFFNMKMAKNDSFFGWK